jgi:hypothetical protein
MEIMLRHIGRHPASESSLGNGHGYRPTGADGRTQARIRRMPCFILLFTHDQRFDSELAGI